MAPRYLATATAATQGPEIALDRGDTGSIGGASIGA